MFFKKHRKSEEEAAIELQIKDMKLYLENNYKDLAIQARKDAISLLEKYHEEGKLKAESYEAYKKILDDYTENMKNYNHQQFYHS